MLTLAEAFINRPILWISCGLPTARCQLELDSNEVEASNEELSWELGARSQEPHAQLSRPEFPCGVLDLLRQFLGVFEV